MREITLHHDGHGLTEALRIETTDEPGADGLSSNYSIVSHESTPINVAAIRFREGPRLSPDSIPGVTEGCLLAILIDRFEGFQRGPFACYENIQTLMHLRRALSCEKERAHERAGRGVLGKNEL